MTSYFQTNDQEVSLDLLPDSENGEAKMDSNGKPRMEGVTEEEGDGYKRHQWSSKREYILSAVGYCVGVGNMWRFPYMCNRNGGGEYPNPKTN